jgi:hypothetical protein
VKVEGPLRDPLCAWRFDDANGGDDGAMMAGVATRASPGVVIPLGASGSRPSSSILPKLRPLSPAIRTCLRAAGLGQATRLRVRIAADGTVEDVMTDYRAKVSDQARECVTSVLKKQKFPADREAAAHPDPTTFTLGFSLRE